MSKTIPRVEFEAFEHAIRDGLRRYGNVWLGAVPPTSGGMREVLAHQIAGWLVRAGIPESERLVTKCERILIDSYDMPVPVSVALDRLRAFIKKQGITIE